MSDFADHELADFIASFNALNAPPTADLGAPGLCAETSERGAGQPARAETDSVVDRWTRLVTASPYLCPILVTKAATPAV